jgi:hypothetical protein
MARIQVRDEWHGVVESQDDVVNMIKIGASVGSHNMILLTLDEWDRDGQKYGMPCWFNAQAIVAVRP